MGREAAAGLDPTEPAKGTTRALCPGRLCETGDPGAYQ
ncbi:hypothetical protein L3Q82_012706 [Scortum barcoo]|uniref:Uncharacterized protein n=1 Tax=Scortum barcoo TaxID=214431 RepID=A0ACB8W3N7_9TELE|nr:hypothetical protein L3Q82_012706 [Scortum barcoo]